jgi:hypothetical protein
VRARRRRHRILVTLLVLLFLALIFGAVVWLSRAPFLRLNAVEVSGAQTLSTSTITGYVEQEISGYYYHLFPKNNFFLYPKSAIAAGLLASMPTLQSVSVGSENFHTISVSVTERVPKALWCGSSASSTAESECSYMDQNGVVYAPAPILSDGTSQALPGFELYYGALGSTSPPQYLSPQGFQSLSALVDALATQSATDTIQSVFVDSSSDVYVQFESGFQLIFALSDAGGDVYQRFELALQSDPFKGKQLSDFQYLDLRFGDKLYYMLK